MRLGIFARTYVAPDLAGVLDAAANHGLNAVHFNLRCAGLAALPGELDDTARESIREAFRQRGLEMIGVSGTFNAIHPDAEKRRADTERAVTLIRTARALGTSFVSLCTGTRDANDMWRAHLENQSAAAWRDLRQTLDRLLEVAHQENVLLGIEPEHANVVNSAQAARRLLDEVSSPNLRVILDGANLVGAECAGSMAPVLEEGFELLSPDIVQVHAKEIPPAGAGTIAAPGSGRLDWACYFDCMRRSGYEGPVVLHNLEETDIRDAVSFLRQWVP